MKKLLLVFAIAFCSKVSSQVYVEDVNINDLDIKYVQLVGYNTSMFGQKMEVMVDYGQKAKFLKADGIKDASGNKMKFNSMIDALNFMNKNGWKFINYTEAQVGRKIRFLYLLEKKN